MDFTDNSGNPQDLQLKICCTCGQEKLIAEFHLAKGHAHGRSSRCKTCACARTRAWARENRDRKARGDAAYQKEHKKRHNAANRRYRRSHMAQMAAKTMRRYIGKVQATPKWANGFFISEIYELARLRTELTGIRWEVDHIIPLRGDLVSGLHVETNLQVIPARLNRVKSNIYVTG